MVRSSTQFAPALAVCVQSPTRQTSKSEKFPQLATLSPAGVAAAAYYHSHTSLSSRQHPLLLLLLLQLPGCTQTMMETSFCAWIIPQLRLRCVAFADDCLYVYSIMIDPV